MEACIAERRQFLQLRRAQLRPGSLPTLTEARVESFELPGDGVQRCFRRLCQGVSRDRVRRQVVQLSLWRADVEVFPRDSRLQPAPSKSRLRKVSARINRLVRVGI